MKNFNNTVVLTSKNPEAFLNFSYDSEDLWIYPEGSTSEDGVLYINGLDINNYDYSTGYSLVLDSTNNYASFHIYTDKNYNFDINIQFKCYDIPDFSIGTLSVYTYDVSILNRPYIIEDINFYDNKDYLSDNEASFLILRTNPKFTGNIVLNIDSSENLYLDTFKVSDILSNKKYRKQKVSANSILSHDIKNIFSTLPRGELFRIESEDTLDISKPKTDLEKQFYTTYNYGARLLKDDLYDEDYAILAPLWINSKLPDYFTVFRLNGTYNEETYNNENIDFLKYFKDSSIVKSWSLKNNYTLGNYLQTHLNDLKDIRTPVFLSLSNPTNIIGETDPNTWYGIAVDKGIVTGRSETTYFFDLKSNNYTDLNAFVSLGFERNNLLCPNLLNLQFLFNDNDVSLYEINRYFGLYLTENVLYKIAYYSDTSNGNIDIISLDGKDSSIFINSLIFDSSGNINDIYKNRIFVLNDGNNLYRITNVNQINGTIKNSYVSKPYENVFSTYAEKRETNPFVILTLNSLLTPGEHLRVINKTQNKIWEIYSVDASTFDNSERYCTISENVNYPTVYRTYFNIKNEISDQIKEIETAFETFKNYENILFRVGISGKNWISLILNDDASVDEEWVFQRILSLSGSYDDITFFGVYEPTENDIEIVSYDASYGPIDFEFYGDRESITIDFFNKGDYNLYSLSYPDNIKNKFVNPLLYQDTSLWYRKIIDFEIKNNSYQYIKDPLSISDKILIMTNANISIVKNKLNAYSIYPLNISLMGINPVKDIDYNVYDISLGYINEYAYKREDDASSYKIFIPSSSEYSLFIKGSYVVESGNGTLKQLNSYRIYNSGTLFNTFDSSVDITASSDTIITYAVLDGSYNYKSLKEGYLGNDENLSNYYDSSTKLKYGLIVPYVSKWVTLGDDCRGNPLRLKLNVDNLDVSTNFIPTLSKFTQEISYPQFKYLTPGIKAWESYIFYDINDVIYDISTSEYLTIKEAIFKYPYVDFFSKLVYSNYNIDSRKDRSSIVYYNQYKDTLDVICLGLNFSIKVSNIAKNIINPKEYDKYRFSFISTPSKNKDNKRPIEVIINENTKTILMIWYQGNDELNYTYRYSSFLPGKSLLDSNDYGFVHDNSSYSFVKTPYYVNNSTITKSIVNFYGTGDYSNDTTNRYAQLNKNLKGFNSIWNAYGTNNYINSNIFITDPDRNTYNTFSQYVSYNYYRDSNTYGDYVINYGYNYDNNKNWYVNNTTNYVSLLYYLNPAKNYVMYYIIRGNKVYNSYDFGSITNPLNIYINSPKTYRNMITYNGWYKPKFIDIFKFKFNEEKEIIDNTQKDFIFSNTNIKSYNTLLQMWGNKIVSSITSNDITRGNAIVLLNNFDMFKSTWDANYYIKDSSYINGYLCNTELPSFFGSKLPKLPEYLSLDNWNANTLYYEIKDNNIFINCNLTQSIIKIFKENIKFLNNWSGLTSEDIIIDNYIKYTILPYYSISLKDIKLEIYYKEYDGQLIYYTLDDTFTLNENKNVMSNLSYINNEHVYNITLPLMTPRYSYFIKITLFEL